jgi:hypothetical protein
VQGRGDLSYPNLNNVHVRTLEIVYPGRHRIDEVAHRVRDLVGASISMRVPSYRAGTGIQLITRATGSEPPTDARVPLVPLRSDARVVDTDEGFVVSWIRERTVRLQLFDGRHYKAPPKSPSAQLDVATHRLRVVVDVSTIRGDVAAVTLVGVGYTSAGDFVRQQSARTPVSRSICVPIFR